MKLLVLLALHPSANASLTHNVVVSDSINSFPTTLGGGVATHDEVDGAQPFPPRLETELGGSGLTISAGVGGCPGPVVAHVYTSLGAWQEFGHAYVSSTVYSGTGTLSLDTGSASLLQYDRGYEYYVTLDIGFEINPGLPVYPDMSIDGLTHANFLGSSFRSLLYPHGTGDRFRWAGFDPLRPGSPRGDRIAVIFGVDSADIPALSEIKVGLPGSLFFSGQSAIAYLSKGFRAPGALVSSDPLFHILRTDSNGREYLSLQPWWNLSGRFPEPNTTLPPPPRRNNTLVKRIDTTFIPGSPGTPAFAGQPALPARTVSVTEQVCSWGPDYALMARQGWTFDRSLAEQQGGSNAALGALPGWLPPGFNATPRTGTNWAGYSYSQTSGSGWQIPYANICTPVTRQIFIPAQPFIPPTPAVPPTPAQTLREFHIGWTGRARSIRSFPGNGRVRFKALKSVTAAVVGLNSEFRQTGFSDMRFAFRLENGSVRSVDQGGTITPLGTYNDGDQFEIRRMDGRITYRINGIVVRDIPNSGSPMHLDAIMFTGGDNIYDPELQGLTSSGGQLQPLVSAGGGMQFVHPPVVPVTTSANLQPLNSVGWGSTRPGANGVANLQPLQVVSRTAQRSAVALASLSGQGSNYPYAASVTALLPMTAEGEGGLGVPAYAVANGMIGFVAGSGSMQTGGLIAGDVSFQPLVGLASDRPYAAAAGAMAPIDGTGILKSALEMLDVSVMDLVFADSGVTMVGELAVVMTSTGHVSGLLSYQGAVNAEVMSDATVAMTHALSALLSANVISTVSAASLEAFSQAGASVWAVNAQTNATSRYEGFGFNSFAKIGDRYFGAKDGGIYALDGDTDAGTQIQAMLALGKHNFGTRTATQLMRLENCYMGVASDGRLVLRVRAEGREYVYRTRDASPELQAQRVDIGRGLRANFMEFEVWNENGDDFDIQTIEFTAVVLSRRI